MDITSRPTGPMLREERGGITPTELGRAMGYGSSPHSRVLQIEAQVLPSERAVARYRAALAAVQASRSVAR